MNAINAVDILRGWDNEGRYIYTINDLTKLFANHNRKALNATLARLVQVGVLIRATKGIYVYAFSKHLGGYTIEKLADTIRRDEYNFISLESALSAYGRISQIPVDRITVMTTGRSGEFKTPFGVIEFTHTKAKPEEILANTVQVADRPLRVASEEYALHNLKRVGRNMAMVDEEERSLQ